LITAGHGDKESVGERWDQMPRANSGMVGRQARERDKRRRGIRLWAHGSCRKEWSGLRPRTMATEACAFPRDSQQ
jgi:hypothetical protein